VSDNKEVKKSDVNGEVKQPPNAGAQPPKTAEQLMMDVLIADAAARAQEAESKRDSARRKNIARQQSADDNESAKSFRIRRCSHLKGGRNRPYNAAKDYSIYLHTFIEGTKQIKCFICGMAWREKDTREHIYRDGRELRNPTFNPPTNPGIGWSDALEMLKSTSNKPSSSEQILSSNGPKSEVEDLKRKLAELEAQVASSTPAKF